MADKREKTEIQKESPQALAAVESSEFEEAYGEPFSKTLDLNTWSHGEDLLAAYARLDQEVGEALKQEDEYRREVRKHVFPQLNKLPDAAPNAGIYTVPPGDLEKVHK